MPSSISAEIVVENTVKYERMKFEVKIQNKILLYQKATITKKFISMYIFYKPYNMGHNNCVLSSVSLNKNFFYISNYFLSPLFMVIIGIANSL